MKNACFLICMPLLLLANMLCYAQDEFYGPLQGWANVKKRFGAKGDGKADDTKFLQRALDSLSDIPRGYNTGNGKGYSVVYLPAGTYNISETLVLRGKIGVCIIGEDPAATIIKWTGNDNDTLFWSNGAAYFKVSRLTWDAGNKKNMECVGIHWKDKWKSELSQSYAALNIELSDMVFRGNPAFGISGGTLGGGGAEGTGYNDSEIAVKRCSFNNCSQAGIRIAGYNALDYWIWDCRFIDCYNGVWNSFGNYHVYRSLFKRSKLCDLFNKNGYYTSVRHSYSVGSRDFSADDGASSNPFKRIFQGNTIINTAEIPIEYYHLGCITLLDNQVSKSRNKEYPMLVNQKSGYSADLSMLSVGNTYGYAEPLRLAATEKKRLIKADDKIIDIPLADGSVFEKTMPATPVKLKASIFEVPPNANTAGIQKIIDDAARSKGARPVVHFAFGKYYIDRPLSIPAGADMRIVGDGLIYSSQLLPADLGKFSGKYLVEINGPSAVSIQDIQIGSDNGTTSTANAILFRNIDQKGASLIMDQLYSYSDTSLMADGLDNIYIEKNNSFFSSGNYISGGKLQKAGKGSFTVNCFGGQFANLTVLNNAKFLSKDCWWEGPERQPLRLRGDGDITIDGAMIAPANPDSLPTLSVQHFRGRISLLNMYIQGGLNILPDNKDLEIFGWNLHFYFKLNPFDFAAVQRPSYKAMFAGITVQNFDKNNPIGNNPFFVKELQANVTDETAYVVKMLDQTRKAIPSVKNNSTAGASSIRLNRVTLGFLRKGITIVNQ